MAHKRANPASVHHTFAALHLPPDAYRYVTAKVLADLPALRDQEPAGVTGVGGAAAVAGALRAIGLAYGGADGGEATHTKEPRTIVDAYKETYRMLLRYCNVTDSSNVAFVWQRLTNCHKSE